MIGPRVGCLKTAEFDKSPVPPKMANHGEHDASYHIGFHLPGTACRVCALGMCMSDIYVDTRGYTNGCHALAAITGDRGSKREGTARGSSTQGWLVDKRKDTSPSKSKERVHSYTPALCHLAAGLCRMLATDPHSLIIVPYQHLLVLAHAKMRAEHGLTRGALHKRTCTNAPACIVLNARTSREGNNSLSAPIDAGRSQQAGVCASASPKRSTPLITLPQGILSLSEARAHTRRGEGGTRHHRTLNTKCQDRHGVRVARALRLSLRGCQCVCRGGIFSISLC